MAANAARAQSRPGSTFRSCWKPARAALEAGPPATGRAGGFRVVHAASQRRAAGKWGPGVSRRLAGGAPTRVAARRGLGARPPGCSPVPASVTGGHGRAGAFGTWDQAAPAGGRSWPQAEAESVSSVARASANEADEVAFKKFTSAVCAASACAGNGPIYDHADPTQSLYCFPSDFDAPLNDGYSPAKQPN